MERPAFRTGSNDRQERKSQQSLPTRVISRRRFESGNANSLDFTSLQ